MAELDLPVQGYEPVADPNGYALPVAAINPSLKRVYIDTSEKKPETVLKEVEHDPWETGKKVIDKLFGLNGQERYQLWPEKIVREALSAGHDVMEQGTVAPGLRREDYTDIPSPDMPTKDSTWLGKALNIAPVGASPADSLIEKAQAVSALAGTGGMAGTGEGAALGSGPMLRPALKYKDKIYKAPVGGQHLDALPPALYDEFQKLAMSGEDINHYNFGFMNHKGQFLDREKALDYAVKEGLVDPTAGQYGALTSTLLADSSKPGAAIEAMAKAEPFYSALEHNVKQINQQKMNGEAWLGTLANKPGVKPEELEWTGLKSFLEENKGKPVTKAQIEEHLANNKVELKEVSKGSANLDKSSPYYNKELERVLNNDSRGTFDDMHLSLSNDAKAYETLMRKHPELKNDDDWASTVLNSVVKGGGETKYHSYQLPGGENYREMLLTLPDKARTARDIAREKGYPWDELTTSDIRQLEETARAENNKSKYRSSHWDEPNILAHVRMNDRTMPVDTHYKVEGLGKDFKTREEAYAARDEAGLAGKSKVTEHQDKKSLHLEEIQSDWHQQGRDKGYKGDSNKVADEYAKATKYANSLDKSNPDYGKAWEKAAELGNQLSTIKDSSLYGVPDAPFKKSWHELALKRMIREAAEKGYDRLSWTPGEAQAARYDLSKQVSELRLVNKSKWTDPNFEYRLDAFDKNGNRVINKGINTEKEAAELIGKEAATKLFNSEKLTGGDRKLTGQDLKIGGEGMKGFYDQIIPKALEKLGKEHGVKVKTIDPTKELNELILKRKEIHEQLRKAAKEDSSDFDKLSLQKKEIQAKIEKLEQNKTPIHYIDIPQSLKDTAMHKGFPLFAKGIPIPLMPVDHDPFEKKK